MSDAGHKGQSAYSQHFRDNGGTGHLHEDDVIQTNAVERVEEGQATLDLVCLDHSLQDVAHGELLALASKMIGHGEYGTEIVRRMTPFRSKEAIVKVKPADLRANVEGAAHRVKLVVCTRDLGSCRNVRTDNRIRLSNAPFGTTVPSTTGPKSCLQCSKRRPSNPHPMVSIKHNRAVSNANDESTL